jgi:catechol 2,3-dioxygenase-like lactoylglutathione lyase family enzyme
MELGALSISLAVKDLDASRTFYEKFGFKAFAADPSQNLTFNPGWDQNAQKLPTFTDERELQRRLNLILIDQHV